MLFGKNYLESKKPCNSLFSEPKELFYSSLFFRRDRTFFPLQKSKQSYLICNFRPMKLRALKRARDEKAKVEVLDSDLP